MKTTLISLLTILSLSSFASSASFSKSDAIEVFKAYFAKDICSEFVYSQEWDYFCGENGYVYDDLRIENGKWTLLVRLNPYTEETYSLEDDGSISFSYYQED